MLELLALAIALIGSFAVGLYDLKTSNIPDIPVIGMAASGILIFTADGFLTGNFSFLTQSIATGILFAVLGMLMYYTGSWGGGDAELLSAMGFLVPVIQFQPLVVGAFVLPFQLTFIINLFLTGFGFSLLYLLFFVFSQKKGIAEFRPKKSNAILYASTVLSMLSIPYSFSLAQPLNMILLAAGLVFLTPAIFRLSNVSTKLFIKKIPAKKLQPDDMLGEDIKSLNLSRNLLRGLTEKEVRAIRRSRKFVLIRDGIRYGLAFPLALLATILFGDLIFFIV